MDRISLDKKGLVVAVILLFLGMSIVPSTSAVAEKSSLPTFYDGNTLYVGGNGPGNYTRIQDAIDNASDGDTVFVYDDSSPYYENLKINKSINLIGENRDTTIIENNMGYAIVVDADKVNISGFTITASSTLWYPCIVLHSNHNRISNNIIKNYYDAIFSMNSSHNDISNNIITENIDGIDLGGSHNEIVGNTISHIKNTGVYLGQFNNLISGNTIKYCDMGIYIALSSSNIISRNIIQNNNVGVFLLLTTDTKIIQNDFIDNDISASFAKSLIIEIWLKIACIQGGEPDFLMFKPFIKNTWYDNYWGEIYVYPYLISGYRGFLTNYTDFIYTVFDFLEEYDSSIFNSVAVDWHPAQKPYDIS